MTKTFVRESENGYDEIISPLPYRDNIRSSLIEFKFKNIKYLGYTFAKAMYNELKNRNFISSDCYILPVPIHISRDRDYNQSAVLAKHLSEWLGIDVLEDALFKIKPISRLSGMGLEDKKLYIKNSFLYNPCMNLSGKTVIVVDDVYTSGTTLLEISKYLRMYGAEHVYAVTACHSKL
jgi:ComF family protein